MGSTLGRLTSIQANPFLVIRLPGRRRIPSRPGEDSTLGAPDKRPKIRGIPKSRRAGVDRALALEIPNRKTQCTPQVGALGLTNSEGIQPGS